MQEIPFSSFERVRPLFDPISYNRPAIFTVFEGRQAGRVFVDRPDNPRAAALISDFSYFAGSPDGLDLQEQVGDWLEREVLPKRGRMLFFPFTPLWQTVLQTALARYELTTYERITFEFNAARFRELQNGWRGRIPTGYELRRIDAATAPAVGGIPELWGSVDNFLMNGFGYCLVDEDQNFVSSAQTVFIGDGRAETGVGTREGHRRKGLAAAACCAYLEHCLENALQPEWGCVLNPPSEQLADRLGFGNKQSRPFLYVRRT